MGRKPKQQRSAEEKLAIVMEGLKSGNIAETCRKFEIAPNLFYRWKDEEEKAAPALTMSHHGQPLVVSGTSPIFAAARCTARCAVSSNARKKPLVRRTGLKRSSRLTTTPTIFAEAVPLRRQRFPVWTASARRPMDTSKCPA